MGDENMGKDLYIVDSLEGALRETLWNKCYPLDLLNLSIVINQKEVIMDER
jgi:hypothetical protein